MENVIIAHLILVILSFVLYSLYNLGLDNDTPYDPMRNRARF